MNLKPLISDQRGGNPLYGAIVLIAIAFVFLMVYAYIAEPFNTIVGEIENASTNPNKPDTETEVRTAFIGIVLVGIFAVVVWYLAYTLRREDQQAVYLR